jgi:hypothetical protein
LLWFSTDETPGQVDEEAEGNSECCQVGSERKDSTRDCEGIELVAINCVQDFASRGNGMPYLWTQESSSQKKGHLMDPRKGTHTFTYYLENQKEERRYDVFKLWELAKDLEIVQADVEFLYNRFDLTRRPWADPVTLLMDRDKYIQSGKWNWVCDHLQRVFAADLDEPILLVNNHIAVVDGHHRIVKAHLESRKVLPAKRFNELPDFARLRP